MHIQLPTQPLIGPEVSHLGPEVSHLSPEVSHLGPEVSHLSPEVSHLSPEVSHLGPEVSHLGPEVSHLGPEVSHLSPEVMCKNSVYTPLHNRSTCYYRTQNTGYQTSLISTLGDYLPSLIQLSIKGM